MAERQRDGDILAKQGYFRNIYGIAANKLSLFGPLLPQPNFLHHLSGSFSIGFIAGCLPALILLYCFLSALSEIKFVKGLVFFLLLCGLQIGVGVFFEVSFLWWWLVKIVVLLLLFQGVIGLYKAEKVKRYEKLDHQQELKAKKTTSQMMSKNKK